MKGNESEGLKELLCQALETEMGGIQVYRTALRCAVNADLKKEWQEYLEQTENHERIVRGLFSSLDLDPGMETPGRTIVREKGKGLVAAMEKALSSGKKDAAQLVACECVVEAETKDHLNWELIGEVAKKQTGETGKALKAAHDEVEDEEDEHLYHTTGWCRELWLQSLGQPAVLPPPEERKDVKTAIGAARAKASRRPKSQGEKTASSSRSSNGGGRGGKRQPSRSSGPTRSART
jgi:rubrerythrin